jgi:hypothetical protein
MKEDRALLILLVIYGTASLFHHVHNAEFLAEYPNMPTWLSRPKVYLAWLGVTAVGVVGYGLARRGYEILGLFIIAVYAALGFDGLGHYTLASSSEHTATMNFTICLEVATAALLLVAAARLMVKRRRGSKRWEKDERT